MFSVEGLLSNKSGNAAQNKFAPANLYLSEHRIPLRDRFRLYGGQDDMICLLYTSDAADDFAVV